MAGRVKSIYSRLLMFLLPWALISLCGAQRQEFGVNIHRGVKALELDAALAPAGLTLRSEVLWSAVEDSTPGVLTFPSSYKELDDEATNARQRGQRPLIVLDYGNKFYDGGERPMSQAAIDAFANYARFIVSHFKGRVVQFEVYNEWNINLGSHLNPRPRQGCATAYSNLLRSVFHAIKEENPDAIVIGGAVSGLDDAWIDEFIHVGGLAYLDGFSIHPYVHNYSAIRPKPPANVKSNGSGSTQTDLLAQPIPGTPEQAIAWLDRLENKIQSAATGKNIPIYITEIGWPTYVGGQGHGVSEAVAAAYLQRFMLLASARPWIGGVWWYDLLDDGPDPTNQEHRFGLLHEDRTRKPAYVGTTRIKDILYAPARPRQSQGSDGEIAISGQYADGSRFLAAWLPTDDFTSSRRSTAINNMFQTEAASASSKPAVAVGAVPLILTQ